MRPRPASTSSSEPSTNVTASPARAQISTMPEPIVPQPTTPTVRTSCGCIDPPRPLDQHVRGRLPNLRQGPSVQSMGHASRSQGSLVGSSGKGTTGTWTSAARSEEHRPSPPRPSACSSGTGSPTRWSIEAPGAGRGPRPDRSRLPPVRRQARPGVRRSSAPQRCCGATWPRAATGSRGAHARRPASSRRSRPGSGGSSSRRSPRWRSPSGSSPAFPSAPPARSAVPARGRRRTARRGARRRRAAPRVAPGRRGHRRVARRTPSPSAHPFGSSPAAVPALAAASLVGAVGVRGPPLLP